MRNKAKVNPMLKIVVCIWYLESDISSLLKIGENSKLESFIFGNHTFGIKFMSMGLILI